MHLWGAGRSWLLVVTQELKRSSNSSCQSDDGDENAELLALLLLLQSLLSQDLIRLLAGLCLATIHVLGKLLAVLAQVLLVLLRILLGLLLRSLGALASYSSALLNLLVQLSAAILGGLQSICAAHLGGGQQLVAAGRSGIGDVLAALASLIGEVRAVILGVIQCLGCAGGESAAACENGIATGLVVLLQCLALALGVLQRALAQLVCLLLGILLSGLSVHAVVLRLSCGFASSSNSYEWVVFVNGGIRAGNAVLTGCVIRQSQRASLIQSLGSSVFLTHVLGYSADMCGRVLNELIAFRVGELAAAQGIEGVEILQLLLLLALLQQGASLLRAI